MALDFTLSISTQPDIWSISVSSSIALPFFDNYNNDCFLCIYVCLNAQQYCILCSFYYIVCGKAFKQDCTVSFRTCTYKGLWHLVLIIHGFKYFTESELTVTSNLRNIKALVIIESNRKQIQEGDITVPWRGQILSNEGQILSNEGQILCYVQKFSL